MSRDGTSRDRPLPGSRTTPALKLRRHRYVPEFVSSRAYSSVTSLYCMRQEAGSGTEIITLGPPPVVDSTVPAKPSAYAKVLTGI